MRGLVWFREDLRVQDNMALFHASKQCDGGVIATCLIDTQLWRNHHMAACRVEFILRGLEHLSKTLEKLNIPLLVFEVTHTQTIPETLYRLTHEFNIQSVFFNRQYEINEQRRDQAVTQHLEKNSIFVYSYDDQVILAPNSVVTQQNGYFKIFTPYKRAWQQLFSQRNIGLLPPLKPQKILSIKSTVIPKKLTDFDSSIEPTLWPAGEKAAETKLTHFIEHHLVHYDTQRDFPALTGTSQLSPYLSTGMISPRQCFLAALSANNHQLITGNKGAITWMSELIWREFYKHLLVAVPRVSMGKPYQLHTEKLPWNYDESLFIAWSQGKTGYPIIDAAIRQLHTTGWMHNRLRMIVAMFFSKNLFLDWRLGEQYFIRHLIDGDLAANNGGWQWCASTGTDAAPYFRIFNTVTQSERFDPDGIFIRQYCPELAKLDNKAIHDPSKRAPYLLKKCAYPQAIVDLAQSRQRFLAAFKNI